MRRKKSSEDDVKITHNNIMLDMDPSLISYIKSRAIEELNRNKEDINKGSEFDVNQARDDMRARVIIAAAEKFLSKITKRFRKKGEKNDK